MLITNRDVQFSLQDQVMAGWWVKVTFKPMDKILRCYHSNETSSAVLSHGTIHLVCSSNFWVCGWNPIMLLFKGNLFDRTFAPYCLFFRIIKKLKYYFFIIRSASFNFDYANKKIIFYKRHCCAWPFLGYMYNVQ